VLFHAHFSDERREPSELRRHPYAQLHHGLVPALARALDLEVDADGPRQQRLVLGVVDRDKGVLPAEALVDDAAQVGIWRDDERAVDLLGIATRAGPGARRGKRRRLDSGGRANIRTTKETNSFSALCQLTSIG
jgi:hypothetical protein